MEAFGEKETPRFLIAQTEMPNTGDKAMAARKAQQSLEYRGELGVFHRYRSTQHKNYNASS